MRPLPVHNPPNPFQGQEVEYLLEDGVEAPTQGFQLYQDTSKTILSKNQSPDVGMRWSVNPYRGCYHGCAYCYARPSHQYLGFGAGSDFERRVVFKPRASDLLRAAFEAKSWRGEAVLFSGNTDCYQPIEASLRLTQACLRVCGEYRNPFHIITKAPLIERDIELLVDLAKETPCGVTISVPFWDPTVARCIEPGAATPQRRIRTIRRLAEAGLDVSVNVAPLIPGLADRDLVRILEACRAAGARRAGMILVRLPAEVKQVFVERLEQALPERVGKVLGRIREARGGQLNDSRFGARMRGEGHYAEMIWNLFRSTCARLGFEQGIEDPMTEATTTFRRPTDPGGQLRLFV
ncbi:MAG: PA0069 family radical SAM protein [Myxococcales bacterium]|nr:PA0069 family radical SAM protein [Myxococcales bacterium]